MNFINSALIYSIIYLVIFFILYFAFFLTYSLIILPLKNKFKEETITVIDSIEKDYIIFLVLLIVISTINKLFIFNTNVIFTYIDLLIIFSGTVILSTGIGLLLVKTLERFFKYKYISYIIGFLGSLSLILYILYVNYFNY